MPENLVETISDFTENKKVNLAELTASNCKQPGEMTNNIMNDIRGSKSDDISNQSTDEVNNVVSQNNVDNDILKTMYQFINEKCEFYKQVTNETLIFN